MVRKDSVKEFRVWGEGNRWEKRYEIKGNTSTIYSELRLMEVLNVKKHFRHGYLI